MKELKIDIENLSTNKNYVTIVDMRKLGGNLESTAVFDILGAVDKQFAIAGIDSVTIGSIVGKQPRMIVDGKAAMISPDFFLEDSIMDIAVFDIEKFDELQIIYPTNLIDKMTIGQSNAIIEPIKNIGVKEVKILFED